MTNRDGNDALGFDETFIILLTLLREGSSHLFFL